MAFAVCLAEFDLKWVFLIVKGRLSWDMPACHLFSAVWTRVATLARLSLAAVCCCVAQGQELAWGRGAWPPSLMHRYISFRKNLKHCWEAVHHKGRTSPPLLWCGLLVLISGFTRAELFLPVKLSGNSELPDWRGKQRVVVIALGHFGMPSRHHPFALCVSLQRHLCRGGLCVPSDSGSWHKGQWDFLMPLLCWGLDLFQLIALVNYSLWCYVAVLWSKISSCPRTDRWCHLFLSLIKKVSIHL